MCLGKYEKLISNTAIFAIGSFSSKLLVFFMMSYYTRMLSPAELGVAERITTISNLLMPFVMLSINEAIIRFAMDKSVSRSQVFSIGIKTVLIGFIVFCVFVPVMLFIDMLAPYTAIIYLYVLMGMLKAVTAQFIRSMELVRLYAFDGFFATFTTIGFNILFLSVFGWSTVGFVLSIVASNILSIVFLFVTARLWRYIDLKNINKRIRREMLRYSIPLIPTTMFWWIINASDRYMVSFFCGDAPTGILAVAHKIPSLLTIVSAIFYQAWQLSAVSESGHGESTTRFYNQIFDYYSTMLFVAASAIIVLIRPITGILYAPAYFESWEYVPFLVIAEVFSSLVTFLGSFYMVSKRNATVPVAIFIGAIANIGLNFLLIPQYGVMGAVFATFVSYLLAFIIRSVDVLRVVKLDLRWLPISCSVLLLMIQGALLINDVEHMWLVQIAMFCAMLLLNFRPVMRLFFALLDKVSGIISR